VRAVELLQRAVEGFDEAGLEGPPRHANRARRPGGRRPAARSRRAPRPPR
jgi:hypothetical protein